MADYFEIDFLHVEASKSGDAIAVRYERNGVTLVHVVDAGFQSTGDHVVKHIRRYYGDVDRIDNVVATHPDGDHTGGLRTVLEEFEVGALWMLRPWKYARELLPRFSRFTSEENLKHRLCEVYPNLAALEEIAVRKSIPIIEPLQGAAIGAFTVLAPTKRRYLDMVVESDRTPEVAREQSNVIGEGFRAAVAKALNFIRGAWGAEVFSTEETSAENEMSVVQFAELCGQKILLTGDAGRAALAEAADFAPLVGLTLPGIDKFQVPHHGSRRNVSTELLDRWLGRRLASRPADGEETFTAMISSAKADEDHPRKAVVRAMIHRGAKVICTEGINIWSYKDAPARADYKPIDGMSYPDEQEE